VVLAFASMEDLQTAGAMSIDSSMEVLRTGSSAEDVGLNSNAAFDRPLAYSSMEAAVNRDKKSLVLDPFTDEGVSPQCESVPTSSHDAS